MNYKILIIEDDSVIQKELKTLLKGHGYEVQAVEDVQILFLQAIVHDRLPVGAHQIQILLLFSSYIKI